MYNIKIEDISARDMKVAKELVDSIYDYNFQINQYYYEHQSDGMLGGPGEEVDTSEIDALLHMKNLLQKKLADIFIEDIVYAVSDVRVDEV